MSTVDHLANLFSHVQPGGYTRGMSDSEQQRKRPYGKEEVMTAVECAALELLATHGPEAVSVRDIAHRAGVNHALVHRHFGGKDELLRTVLRRQSDAIGSAANDLESVDVPAVLRLLTEHPTYWRALARTVLDSPALLDDSDFPAARTFLALLGRETSGDAERAGAAVSGALVLGWLVFGPHLARAVNVPDSAVLHQAVSDAVVKLVGELNQRR